MRTDQDFRAGWTERSAELTDAILTRLEQQKAAGRMREDIPNDVLLSFLDLVLDGFIARIASGQADDANLSAVLDLVEDSVRRSN